MVLSLTDPHSGTKRYLSSEAMGLICELSTRRLPMVAGEATKINGDKMPFTNEQLDMMKVLRVLHYRMERADYRATEKEWGIVLRMAEFLIQLHAQNKGLSTPETWEWTSEVWRETSMPPSTYAVIFQMIHSGAVDPVQ